MADIVQQDVMTRLAVIQARKRLQPYRRVKRLQLWFEDLTNSLWKEESYLVDIFYPFLEDMGVWGHLGPPSVSPIVLHRNPNVLTKTPFGSGLSIKVFHSVPTSIDSVLGSMQNLRKIEKRALMGMRR